MRKILLTTLAVICMAGCTKSTESNEETAPNEQITLVGTEWKAYHYQTKEQYYAIRFYANGKATVAHGKFGDGVLTPDADYIGNGWNVYDGTYSLKGKEVSFSLNFYREQNLNGTVWVYEDMDFIKGILIDEETMSVSAKNKTVDTDMSFTFHKQKK